VSRASAGQAGLSAQGAEPAVVGELTGDQVIGSNANGRAGDRGGARIGKPTCLLQAGMREDLGDHGGVKDGSDDR